MLEVMPESTGRILWLRAADRLTDQDYREVFIPRLEAVVREHGRVPVLFHLDPDFQGWTPGAWWEDLKLDLKHLRRNLIRIILLIIRGLHPLILFQKPLLDQPFQLFKPFILIFPFLVFHPALITGGSRGRATSIGLWL
jgi:hypothetical protein